MSGSMQFGGVLRISEWAASPVADIRQVGSTISFRFFTLFFFFFLQLMGQIICPDGGVKCTQQEDSHFTTDGGKEMKCTK